ncbi:MAG TPA: JAB domain-containing protein [Actinomycetota bacterium]|nr:JAB domain-containing protein [Actinomycetota bacterium]
MTQIKVKPEDAIESLVKIIGGVDAEIVFVTCIDDNGDVSDSECFASATEPKNSLPLDELFYLAEQMGAPAVMFTSTSSGPITELHECDVDFTRRLIEGGRERGIIVHDHILVEGDTFRIMSQCTDLWKG